MESEWEMYRGVAPLLFILLPMSYLVLGAVYELNNEVYHIYCDS